MRLGILLYIVGMLVGAVNVVKAQTTVTIGTDTTKSSGFASNPVFRLSGTSSQHHAKSVQLLTAAQLSSAGLTSGVNITNWGYNKTNSGKIIGANSWTLNVYLKNSSATSLASGTSWNTMISGASLVYSATIDSSSAKLPAASGYWMWPVTGFTYAGGAIECYVEWVPLNLTGTTFTSGSFQWQYSAASASQAMGASSTSSIPGTQSAWILAGGAMTSSHFYNTRVVYNSNNCSGQPAPGNTVASSSTVCAGSNVSLSLQNATSGTGLTYLWEESDDQSVWNSFGTNSSVVSYTMGSAPKYFRCTVTCSADPTPGVSQPVQVNINTAAFPEDFSSVNFPPNCFQETDASGKLSRSASGSGSAQWNFYTANTGTTMSLTSPTLISPVGANTFIQFDVAGTTLPTGEVDTIYVQESSDGGASWSNVAALTNKVGGDLNTTGATQSTAFTPASGQWLGRSYPVSSGANRFRLRGVSGFGNNVYIDNLSLYVQPACTAPPEAGTAVSDISSFCASTTANVSLSLTGTSSGAGLTYQWQESADNVVFSNISGATSSNYQYNGLSATAYFRCIVNCSGDADTSSFVTVTASAPPVAGAANGPATIVTHAVVAYNTSGSSGDLQWQIRLQPSPIWTNISGANASLNNYIFTQPGTWELQVVASSSGCNSDNSNTVITTVSLPNDNVCDASLLTVDTESELFTNSGAGLQSGESVPSVGSSNGQSSWGSAADNTVWFRFVAPSSGRVSIHCLPGNWNSQLALWSAATCSDLLNGNAVLLAANDDSISGGTGNAAIETLCLTPGQTYFIQVDGNGTTNEAFRILVKSYTNAAPVFTSCPSDINVQAAAGNCSANVNWTSPSYNDPDNCQTPLTVNASHASGDDFQIGTTTVTYTISDGLNNATCTFNVIVTPNASDVWYADLDGDGYGSGADSTNCLQPAGYVSNGQDCDDSNAQINPGMTEACNGIDDDCAGGVDDNLAPPTAVSAITGNTDVCAPGISGTAAFSTATLSGVSSYVWSVPSGMSIVSGQGTHSVIVGYSAAAIQAGITGQVCVTSANACLNSTPYCKNISYQIATPVTPGSISGSSKMCPGELLTFSVAPVSRAASYNWSLPTNMILVSGGETNVISAQVNAGYTGGSLTVTASNACGTGSIRTKSLAVNLPATPTAISGSKEGLCNMSGVVYSVPVVSNASSYNWTLTGAGSIVSGIGSPSVTVDFSAIGTGSIAVEAVNGCGSSSQRISTLKGSPARPADITGSGTSVCTGDTIPYSVATVSGADNYNWTMTSGGQILSGNGTKNVSVKWLNTPITNQVISVKTGNGCGTSTTRTLSGINVANCPRNGMSSDARLLLMPNPATDHVSVYLDKTDGGTGIIRLVDVSGRIVIEEQVIALPGVPNILEFPLQGLSAGLYTLILGFDGAFIQSKLLIYRD